ncbi:MAG: hypothetical protein ACREJN_11775 [Nitrospiraceae bacterium]
MLLATGIGLVLTAGFAGAAYLLHAAGAEGAARAALWQNTLLQSLVPLNNIGTPERPFYEGTPLNYVMFIAAFPWDSLCTQSSHTLGYLVMCGNDT